MSKQAEAAAQSLDAAGFCPYKIRAAQIIADAYAEREKAVAELVAAANRVGELYAVRGVICIRLSDAVKAVEGGND